ncbi:MAG: hypothetical protein QW803_12895, partial [Candidatus Methanomethylicia archaeon]
ASGRDLHPVCFSAMKPLLLEALGLNVYCSPYVEMMPSLLQLHLINSYHPPIGFTSILTPSIF